MARSVQNRQTITASALTRRLGLTTATALIVGEVIGVGIFLTPAGMAKSLGSPFWMLAVWLTMGASAIGGALCFGALSTRYPEAGGGYVYLREAYGARVAFLYGWISLLVTDPGVTAALASGLARYVRYLHPLSAWGQKGVAAAAILALAAVNVVGVSLGSGVLRTLAALKLVLLGFLVVWGFSFGRGNWTNLTPFWTQRAGSDPLLQALAVGLMSSFYSFGGWWDLSKLAGEMRDPERTLPRAMVLGVSLVTVIYIAISAVFLYLVPASQIASGEAFAALAGKALFGPPGGTLFTWIVIISVTGSLAAMLMASPRVYYAMARDGLFLPAFAAVEASGGTPARAVMLQAVLATLLAVTGTFDEILAFLMVPTLLFLALTVWAVFVLRRGSSLRSPLETPGFPVSPLVFIVPVLALVGLLIMRNPHRAFIGLLVVVAGIPVAVWVARRARSKPTVDDSQALGHTDAPATAPDDPLSVSSNNIDS
jgi:basic amino acid/polyamine antiporter, APA family